MQQVAVTNVGAKVRIYSPLYRPLYSPLYRPLSNLYLTVTNVGAKVRVMGETAWIAHI